MSSGRTTICNETKHFSGDKCSRGATREGVWTASTKQSMDSAQSMTISSFGGLPPAWSRPLTSLPLEESTQAFHSSAHSTRCSLGSPCSQVKRSAAQSRCDPLLRVLSLTEWFLASGLSQTHDGIMATPASHDGVSPVSQRRPRSAGAADARFPDLAVLGREYPWSVITPTTRGATANAALFADRLAELQGSCDHEDLRIFRLTLQDRKARRRMIDFGLWRSWARPAVQAHDAADVGKIQSAAEDVAENAGKAVRDWASEYGTAFGGSGRPRTQIDRSQTGKERDVTDNGMHGAEDKSLVEVALREGLSRDSDGAKEQDDEVRKDGTPHDGAEEVIGETEEAHTDVHEGDDEDAETKANPGDGGEVSKAEQQNVESHDDREGVGSISRSKQAATVAASQQGPSEEAIQEQRRASPCGSTADSGDEETWEDPPPTRVCEKRPAPPRFVPKLRQNLAAQFRMAVDEAWAAVDAEFAKPTMSDRLPSPLSAAMTAHLVASSSCHGSSHETRTEDGHSEVEEELPQLCARKGEAAGGWESEASTISNFDSIQHSRSSPFFSMEASDMHHSLSMSSLFCEDARVPDRRQSSGKDLIRKRSHAHCQRLQTRVDRASSSHGEEGPWIRRIRTCRHFAGTLDSVGEFARYQDARKGSVMASKSTVGLNMTLN